MGADQPSRFVGRVAERRLIDECRQSVQAGEPWVVWVEGEAGIGKTSLVRQCLSGVETFRTLWATADMSESDLPYGVISQLVAQAPTERTGHPLLRSGSIAPSTAAHQIGGQLLALCSDLQGSGPVALVVDDVQWADSASMNALGFVLRRLGADKVLVILISRRLVAHGTGSRSWYRLVSERERFRSVLLEGLSEADVEQLTRHIPGRDASGFAKRLHTHTHGHPLYVNTVLAELSEPEQGVNSPLPVPASLSEGVRHQIELMPTGSRQLLDALAVLDGRYPLAVVAQVAGVTESAEGLEPLLVAGLVKWWPAEPSSPVQIHHPLQRDGVIASLSPTRKKELHRAAVPLVQSAAAWGHRVAATDGVDASLADELEREALQQISEGSVERAATYLLWAAGLSADRPEAERRRHTAAAHLMWADNYARVEQLATEVKASSPSRLRSLIVGALATVQGQLAIAEKELGEVIAGNAPGDEWTSAMAGVWLCVARMISGQSHAAIAAAGVVIAQNAPFRYRVKAIGFTGHCRAYVDGPHAGLEAIAQADLPMSATGMTSDDAWLLVQRGNLRHCAGQLHDGIQDLTTALRLARAHGISVMDEQAYGFLARAQYLSGAWDDAAVNAATAIAVVSSEGRDWAFAQANASAALVASSRGDWQRAQALLGAIQTERFGVVSQVFPAIAAAVLAQAQGDQAQILKALQPILNLPEESGPKLLRIHWLPLWVEGLVGAGEIEEAAQAVAFLTQVSAEIAPLRITAAWLAGKLAERSGDRDSARQHYEYGVQIPTGPDDIPLQRAMIEHSFGQFLLGDRDRRGASEYLRNAYKRYTALGARPFLERCAEDVIACGIQAPRGAPDELLSLTDREQRIAHLITKGMTNQEAARELYLSAKTIEYHLAHIYAKLGISSRRQLRTLLRPSSE
ncbi:hypothetical protein ADK75_36320 [Streptomyces virginiae]|uniref:HTH luxR-type domain-containing protein n=1 Tax=Streptomyces virginiae TaxID=1961 RepID=A0A0L8M1R8_STRVG|nr:AAA family ATPase [Streptomyces virginiae]KOG44315.1 hypothetical protein ADK75_36320 [Streptomyces virginiae]